MLYKEFAELYEDLSSTTKKLEKADILAEFLPKLKGKEYFIYLLRGRVFPDYDESEFGISTQLAIKSIARTVGVKDEKVNELYRKIGDLGDIADQLIEKKKQSILFSKKLDAEKVFNNLKKLATIEGKGSVDKKLSLVVDLLGAASGKEAKYVIRTLLNDLRVGVADSILIDAIGKAFFEGDKEMRNKVEEAYDLTNDFAHILSIADKGIKDIEDVEIVPGKPIKVMLPVKVTDIDEGFRICGKPLAVEHKYDGFRVLINKDSKDNVSLFTRRLDNVTKQFPDVVEVVKKYVKADSFVLDSEVVGYDPKTKKYKAFEAISQRIRRKYDIDEIAKKLPVEVNVFDVIYVNGESVMAKSFRDRRKILEKVIKTDLWKIRPSTQFVSDDKKEVENFYHDALQIGEEGVMMKNLDAPYKPGRRVGFMVKMKPDAKDLDLVIVGAEYGTGKRSGALTSYIVACRDGKDKFLEVGKVSSGLKEKEEAVGEGGITYTEMDKLLRPLIISESKEGVKIKPKVVVSVTYQNVQPSPRYSSGYALRFPRITHYRPERGVYDIASKEEIVKEFKRMISKRSK